MRRMRQKLPGKSHIPEGRQEQPEMPFACSENEEEILAALRMRQVPGRSAVRVPLTGKSCQQLDADKRINSYKNAKKPLAGMQVGA